MSPQHQDPEVAYVVEVVVALYIAGLPLADMWAEPTNPTTYYVQMSDGYVLDLIWDRIDGWIFAYQSSPNASVTHAVRVLVKEPHRVAFAVAKLLEVFRSEHPPTPWLAINIKSAPPMHTNN